jgi:hypothetical protein
MRWIALSLVALAVVLAAYRRRQWLNDAGDEWLSAEIKARGYRYRPGLETFDDDLRKRTEARRAHAEQIKRGGRLLETKDDRASKIHIVGGGR